MSLLEVVLGSIALISGLSGLIAWPTFCFLSMRPIEAKVRAEGRDRTGWDVNGNYAACCVSGGGRVEIRAQRLIGEVALP